MTAVLQAPDDNPPPFLGAEEFAKMEKLLGKLLVGATPREEHLILYIHTRLKAIQATQRLDQNRLEYLKRLAP